MYPLLSLAACSLSRGVNDSIVIPFSLVVVGGYFSSISGFFEEVGFLTDPFCL